MGHLKLQQLLAIAAKSDGAPALRYLGQVGDWLCWIPSGQTWRAGVHGTIDIGDFPTNPPKL